MALVSYSDSEGSDSENEAQVHQPVTAKKESSTTSADPFKASKPAPGFSSLVDRGNPRKIRVALPEIKPEDGIHEEEDGPARKKPRTNGGGMFSGFNSLLPAPKRNTQNAAAAASKETSGTGAARKVFSLKTGAAPGFDRQADAEMRHEHALNETTGPAADGNHSDSTTPKPGSHLEDGDNDSGLLKEEDYKKKGNAMVFKPLSVARNPSKKKSPSMFAASRAVTDGVDQTKKGSAAAKTSLGLSPSGPSPSPSSDTASAAPAKPKISLFSFSKEETSTTLPDTAQATVHSSSGEYESVLYNPSDSDAVPGPQADSSYGQQTVEPSSTSAASQPTLDTIVDDLNLSRSQRRQLLGRNPQAAKSRVLTFETDAEYAANQELASREEIAAAQHNPVRAIAPGKHTLRQLVHAANSQREALEESFAAGKRNKKEAGSKYGW